MTETTKNSTYLDMPGLQLYDSLIKAKMAADINTAKYNDADLKARVTTNENAIIVLNGTGEGSIKKQILDQVAKIVADAPEAYDTLKEISDWISSHADDASAMNSQISTNKSDISTLRTLIGTLPEGSISNTIISYISEAIGMSVTNLTSSIEAAKNEAIQSAAAEIKELSEGQVSKNKSDIETLKSKVETLESTSYTPITEEEINSLFVE